MQPIKFGPILALPEGPNQKQTCSPMSGPRLGGHWLSKMSAIGSWGPSDIGFLKSVVRPSVSASHRGSLSINSNVPSLKGLYPCNEACNNIFDILKYLLAYLGHIFGITQGILAYLCISWVAPV